ncbi:hypothetical protein ILYODFUR_018348 [Ilyodon furcidens]|uniref:Uncharacterized protein n=1 Tax=Ilyodon furcidens TaxID=33524 RepID=A0ABV0TKS5_9TELE
MNLCLEYIYVRLLSADSLPHKPQPESVGLLLFSCSHQSASYFHFAANLPLIHLTFNLFKYIYYEAAKPKETLRLRSLMSHQYLWKKPFLTPPVHLIPPPCLHFHVSAELFFISLSYVLTRGFFSISSSLFSLYFSGFNVCYFSPFSFCIPALSSQSPGAI